LGSQDTYYVGTIKGVGRIYQQTYIDTYCKLAIVKLYQQKHAIMQNITPLRHLIALNVATQNQNRAPQMSGAVTHSVSPHFLVLSLRVPSYQNQSFLI
jgi:hypothetical protein